MVSSAKVYGQDLTFRSERYQHYLKTFIEESEEHLGPIDQKLIQLESGQMNKLTFDNLIQSYHTIKGGANMLRLKDINTLVHELESVIHNLFFDKVKHKKQKMELVFQGTDLLKETISLIKDGKNESELKAKFRSILQQLKL